MAGITIHETAFVAAGAELQGEISIGAGSFVHPLARVLATAGPIRIGEGCIVEECVEIRNESSEAMVIGNDNLIGVRSSITSSNIGNGNEISPACSLSRTSLPDDCFLGPRATLSAQDPPPPSGSSIAAPHFEPLPMSDAAIQHGREMRAAQLRYLMVLKTMMESWKPKPGAA